MIMNDKLYKKIDNLKDLLDGKYKERNSLLEEGNIEYFDILDKEIENMELEFKKLEKDLENSNTNGNYKTQLCRFYKNYGKCDKNDKCFYAHGIKELRDNKEGCINQLKCYDETCLFKHPNNWNPYNNKIECSYCRKGFCNKINKKYKHINNNYKNSKFKFIVNKIILINRIIKYLEKNKYKNEKENKSIEKQERINTKINLFIDGKYINNNDNLNKSYTEDNKKDIKKILYQMENDLELYKKKIINNINEINIDDYLKINMKIQLNNIKSKITLLKYNMEDLENM